MNKIAFHGVPRSGTSWVGSIFDSSEHVAYRHQPLFSYAFKSFLNKDSNDEEIEDFFYKILNTDDSFVLQKNEKEKGSIPTFIKSNITHIIYKEARYHNILPNLLEKNSEIKVVGIIRNPKSVISSWYQAKKEFDKNNWCLFEEWEDARKKNEYKTENFYGYKKWKEVACLFLRLQNNYPNRFYTLNYSNLLLKTKLEVQKLFDFCEIPLNKQTIDFIYKSSTVDYSEDPYSVYRMNQNDDKWKDILPIEIINKIDDDLNESDLEVFNK